MNNIRRKQLKEANELIEKAQAIITDVSEEEREAYENLPESLQSSDRGEQMDASAELLEEIADALDTCYRDVVAVIEGEV